MTAAALLLLGLGPLTAATLNVTTNADPACPCMDVRAFFLDAKLTATGGMAELLRSEGSPCNDTDVLDYQSARSSGSSVTAFCYPANYGSSRCSAWDAGPRSKAHACSASRPPAYCSQRWCYVDPQNCRMSEHDIQGTTLFEWSSDYETSLYVRLTLTLTAHHSPFTLTLTLTLILALTSSRTALAAKLRGTSSPMPCTPARARAR